MRKNLTPEIESHRVAGTSNDGCFGAFAILSPDTGRRLVCVVSDGRDWGEEGLEGIVWEHLSVSSQYGCPTWQEFAWAAQQFFEDEECLIQYRPAKSKYVNINPNTLHWWLPKGKVIPMPPERCV